MISRRFKVKAHRGHVPPLAVVTACALCACAAFASASHAGPFSRQDEQYAAEEGISVAQAEFDREVAARAGNIAGDLQRGLGAGYAGVWFDPHTGRFHVGVAPGTDRGLAEAIAAGAGVLGDTNFDAVGHTWAEVQAAEASLLAQLAQLVHAQQVQIGGAAQLNGVVIEVSDALDTAQRATVAEAVSTATVPVAVREVPAATLAVVAGSAVTAPATKPHRSGCAKPRAGARSRNRPRCRPR